jgi:transcription elongation GreA/GreB family factor
MIGSKVGDTIVWQRGHSRANVEIVAIQYGGGG